MQTSYNPLLIRWPWFIGAFLTHAKASNAEWTRWPMAHPTLAASPIDNRKDSNQFVKYIFRMHVLLTTAHVHNLSHIYCR